MSRTTISPPRSRRLVGTAATVAVAILTAGGLAWAATAHWSRGKIPKDASALSAVWCANRSQCWIAVESTTRSYVAEVIHSSDGGRRWTDQALLKSSAAQGGAPASPGPNAIACDNAKICVATAGSLFRTTDGGAKWRIVTQPSGLSTPDAITCWNTECFVSGTATTPGGNIIEGLYTSRNAGATWNLSASWPLGGTSAIFCESARECWATGAVAGSQMYQQSPSLHETTDGGRTWTSVDISAEKVPRSSGPPVGLAGIACTSARVCTAIATSTGPPAFHPRSGLFLHTSDGGTHWELRSAPSPIDYLTGISCRIGSADCWATGFRLNAAGTAEKYGYALKSTDGGVSWSVGSRFAQPLSGIKCTNVRDCVAFGNTLAVYSTNGG